MASYMSGSESDSYGYDFTQSDEEELGALIDNISTPASAPQPTRFQAAGRIPQPHYPSSPTPGNHPSSKRRAPTTVSLNSDIRHAIAVHEVVENISDGDLDSVFSFDNASVSGSHVGRPPLHAPTGGRVSSYSHSSFPVNPVPVQANKVQPRPIVPKVPPGSVVSYPDLSRALDEASKADSSSVVTTDASNSGVRSAQKEPSRRLKNQVEMIRHFRTFPKKPLSVTDLTAGTWCELQHFYTLTRRDGIKKRTHAMQAGSVIHEKLEREIFTPVMVEVTKPVDRYGLKFWNIITGLRTLRDTGITRELEVWGVIDGNIVNGIIDGLSYENPDPELEEDVVSTRGSQSSLSSSQHQLSLGHKVIFITDVKTRMSKTPPPLVQVRGTLIQLFLYHRFLSEMASGRLNYLDVFKRYGVDPDEPFSDEFMAQMVDLNEEVFFTDDSTTSVASDTGTAFVTAVSTPSQLGQGHSQESSFLRYRTLRSLIPLLKFEIQLTFPRGAATIGNIVAVEYRYRSRMPNDPDAGALICINSYYVEPEKLDEYLADTLRWWKGEREPRGVQLDEGWKCQNCEFAGECEWRENLEREAQRKAKLEKQKGKKRDTLGW